MKAPEKVYIDDFGSGFSHGWHTEHSYEKDIEYIRKDAFIEKASTWFANRYQVNSYLDADDIEDFINYMKGESYDR